MMISDGGPYLVHKSIGGSIEAAGNAVVQDIFETFLLPNYRV